MALKLKPGVRLAGIRPETVVGILVARDVYADEGLDCVVTSVCDSATGRLSNSLHPRGLAFDLRLPSIVDVTQPPSLDLAVRARLAFELGDDWDVILHDAGSGAHIHVEFDPPATGKAP